MAPPAALRRIAPLCALLCLLGAGGRALAADAPALRSLIKPGEKAPRFTLNDLAGRPVAFNPGGGTPALVVFWSAFCPLCRELTPSVSAIVRRYAGTVRVFSVNLDGKRFRNAVTAFVKEHRIAYPVLLDDVRDDLFIASDPYGVEKTPTAVLVDGDGTVHAAYAAEGMRAFLAVFDREVSELKKRTPAKKQPAAGVPGR